MIRSMTGFGRAQASVEGYNITVEIRSVNHRYFEFYAKMPRTYSFLEEKVKSFNENYQLNINYKKLVELLERNTKAMDCPNAFKAP